MKSQVEGADYICNTPACVEVSETFKKADEL